jgi:hypothetical protein
MKTKPSIALLIVSISFSGILKAQSSIFQSEKLQKVWEATGLEVPESVLPVPEKGILYVSNIGSTNPTAKENMGFITVLNADGSIKKLHWVTGLNAPKGMAIIGKKLYVTEVDKVTEIDILTGKIVKSIVIDSAVFLNDITADKADNLYISDSRTGTVFILSGNKVSVLLKSKEYSFPNGLISVGDNILLGTGEKVVSINPRTRGVKDFMLNTGGVDGIALIAPDELLFSNWQGTVYTMKVGNDKELLLDTSATESTKSADFGYDSSKKLIYIPTFFGNSVVCYKIIRVTDNTTSGDDLI